MFVLVTFGCSVRGVGSRCLSSNSMTSGAFESVSPGTVTKHHVMGSSALLFHGRRRTHTCTTATATTATARTTMSTASATRLWRRDVRDDHLAPKTSCAVCSLLAVSDRDKRLHQPRCNRLFFGSGRRFCGVAGCGALVANIGHCCSC